jgi:protein-disulfide isomerase
MEVFPAFKAKYIDTGEVRYVAREALTGDPAIAAAGFLTARCAGKDKYFQVVDAIYHAQQEMFTGGEPHAVLLNIARSAGMTDDKFESCIKDETALNALNARWEKYVKDDKINGTPTFVINGKVYDKGEMSLKELDDAVAEAKAGGAAKTGA